MKQGRNYEDSKCAWGYITLCQECVDKLRNSLFGRPHININKEVHGFPAVNCEFCGAAVEPPDNNAYVKA